MKQLIFALSICLGSCICYSQNESSVQLQAAIQFTSTPVLSVNNGDTAFSNSFVMAPALRLFHKKGFGVSYSPYFVTQGSEPGIYMHTVSAGYEHYDGEKVNAEANYTHFFFAGDSSIPYSPLNNELYAFISYKKLWLAPLLSTSLGFGKDKAGQTQGGVSIAAGLTHNFEVKNDKAFSTIEIDPSVIVNAAGNEFYSFLTASKYITHSKEYQNVVKHRNRGRGGSTTTTTTVSTNGFSLENLELNLYSSFAAHHFEVIPAGSLFFPFSPGNNVSGYWQVKLAYDF